MRRRLMMGLGLALIPRLLRAVALDPETYDRRRNRVIGKPRRISAETRTLHAGLRIVDLHADTLLWGRDLLLRADHGHVDLPRLIDGNVALQVFSVVTQMPIAGQDGVGLLAQAQGWPKSARESLRERALYQASRLEQAAAASHGQLVLVRTREDLDGVLARRARGERVVGALLSLEGAQALGQDASCLDAFRQAGFRMIGLTHFTDNAFAGSAHGRGRLGLTDRGRDLVRRMQAEGLVVDLAHASAATIGDVLGMATRPVVVSHTGVSGTCDNRRNLTDGQLVAVARNGGAVGIGYWSVAVCGADLSAIVRAVRHAERIMGADHVALGSDFDGSVTTPLDSARLAELSEVLRTAGASQADVACIMGENALRVLRATLP